MLLFFFISSFLLTSAQQTEVKNFMWSSIEHFLLWFTFFYVWLRDIHTLIEHTAHRSHLDSLGVLHSILSPESPHISWKWPWKRTERAKMHRKRIQVETAWEQKLKIEKKVTHKLSDEYNKMFSLPGIWFQLLLFLGFRELLSEWGGRPADCSNPDIYSCCARTTRQSF